MSSSNEATRKRKLEVDYNQLSREVNEQNWLLYYLYNILYYLMVYYNTFVNLCAKYDFTPILKTEPPQFEL